MGEGRKLQIKPTGGLSRKGRIFSNKNKAEELVEAEAGRS
jgi:hypothetical protein